MVMLFFTGMDLRSGTKYLAIIAGQSQCNLDIMAVHNAVAVSISRSDVCNWSISRTFLTVVGLVEGVVYCVQDIVIMEVCY